MRYCDITSLPPIIEVLRENVQIQRAIEHYADVILAVLADRIISSAAGYQSRFGTLDGIVFSVLRGVHQWDIDPKTIPMPVRRLARREVSVKLGAQDSFEHSDSSYEIEIRRPDGLKNETLTDPARLRALLQTVQPNLVHELTHAWNDYQSKGRFVKNSKSIATKTLFTTYDNDPSEANQQAWSDAYMHDPAEINAFFQSAIAATPWVASFDNYRSDVIERLPQFSHWSQAVQKRLYQRLYQHWKHPPSPRVSKPRTKLKLQT